MAELMKAADIMVQGPLEAQVASRSNSSKRATPAKRKVDLMNAPRWRSPHEGLRAAAHDKVDGCC